MADVITSDVPAGMMRTPEGLIVPVGEKKRETWDYQDFKKLRHASRAMFNREIDTVYLCRVCHQMIHFHSTPFGNVEGECACKLRETV